MDRQEARKIAEEGGWLDKVQTESDWIAVEQGCYYSQKHSDHVIEFFKRFLCHYIGTWAGKPFDPLPWQVDCLSQIFGWLRPDGTRRFHTGYIEIAKKNGKSTLAAAILLYLLVGDGEQGAQVFTAATSRDQAKICFNAAKEMVRKSPKLLERLKILPSTNRITYPKTGSYLAALSSEAGVAEGLDASGIVIDELHYGS